MTVHVKYTAQIHQPIEKAFTIASDVAHITRWAQVKEVRGLDGQTLKAGTTFQLVSHVGGEDRLVDCRVSIHEPPHKFAYTSRTPARSEVLMDFQPSGAHCVLHYSVSITINAFVEPLIKSEMDQRAKADLTRLVKLIESS